MVAHIFWPMEWGIHVVEVQAQNPQIEIWSDASGGWGCAAIWMVSGFRFSGLTF